MSDFLDFKNQIASALQDKVAMKLADLKLQITDEMFNDGQSLNKLITVEEGFAKVMQTAEMLSEAAPNESVVRALKPAFASEFAFYSKAHSFHWNVEGSDFKEFHDLFGGIYEEVYGSIDDFAENIRKAGGYAPNSLQTISELAHIDSEGMIGDPLSMASDLLSDSETLSEMFGVVYKIAEASGAYGLANFLADRQDAHDKHSWMLRSTLKRAGVEIEEDVEGLDELKKSTLGSYIKKASSDAATARVNQGYHELKSNTSTFSPSYHSKEADKQLAKYIKRKKGIDTAADKLAKEDVEISEESKLMGAAPRNLVSASARVLNKISKESQQKAPSVSTPETAGPGPKFGDADFCPEGDKMKPAPKFSSDEKDQGAANHVSDSTKVGHSVSKEEQQKAPSISTPEVAGPGPSFSDPNDKLKKGGKEGAAAGRPEKDEQVSNLVTASAKILNRISKEEQQKRPTVATPESNPGLPSFSDVRSSMREEADLEESEQKKSKVVTPESNPGLPSFSETNAREKYTGKVKVEVPVQEDVEEVVEERFKKGTDIGKPGKNFAKIAKKAAAKYGSKEAGERVAGSVLKKVLAKEEGLPGYDQSKAPASSPVIMNSVSSSKIKKEAVEDLPGQNGTKTPSKEDMIKQGLLTLDKDGNAILKKKSGDATTPEVTNPNDDILAKVGLKKK